MNNTSILTIFKALSDNTRLRIINILLLRTLCVCELQEILEMSEPRISRHLGILKEAGLIDCEKHGKWYHYKISYNNKNEDLFKYLKTEFAKNDKYKQDIERLKTVKLSCNV